MEKDLTNSSLDRKNILNNNVAIQEVYQQVGFHGIKFDGNFRFTKLQIANYFEVDVRTIDRLLKANKEELRQNGYELYTSSTLKRFKEQINNIIESYREEKNDVHDINVVNMYETEYEAINKAPQLGVFTYKAFLNVGMLLSASENAQKLRSMILDIVIDILNKKLGGKTKFINQREEDFLPSAIREFKYNQELTNALDFYVTDNNFKYSQITDKIYKSIFKGNAKEYRRVLNLNAKENVRDTMYSEVLDLIASYENGFASFLKTRYETKKVELSLSETHILFSEFECVMDAFITPLREKARSLMASRDLAFRDALHEKLKDYINEVSPEDFEKFLGSRSMDLEKRLEDNKEVFKRLKDR